MAKNLRGGFDALFRPTDIGAPADDNETAAKLKISMVEPDPDQPRKAFAEEQLRELADSIAEHGVIQPIIVVNAANGYYRIIAGERRWRAAKLAGLTEIPAIVRSYSDVQAAQIALIENLQREDLNPIEEAQGYKSLIDRFGLTQDGISEKIGKSRSNIANTLRLLNLDPELQAQVRSGALSAGHARALLAISDRAQRLSAAERVISEGLTVRQTEALAKEPPTAKPKPKPKSAKPPYPDIERELAEKFGTKVRIKGSQKGRVEIEYYNMNDLIRIVDLLSAE